MRTILFILLCICTATATAQIKAITYDVDTFESGKLVLKIYLPIDIEQSELDISSRDSIRNRSLLLVDAGSGTTVTALPFTGIGRDFIQASYSGDSIKLFLEQFIDKKLTLSLDKTIHLTTALLQSSEGGELQTLTLTAKDVEDYSARKGIGLASTTSEDFVKEYNGTSIITGNSIDFGAEVASPDSVSSYFVTFAYSAPVVSLFRFSFEGRLSTNPDDSLAKFSVSPIHLANYISTKHLLFISGFEYNLRIGLDANQRFTQKRIFGEASFSTLVDNFIDFTMGNSRFRLKPIVSLGIKGFNKYTQHEEDETGFQYFGRLYYDIPIGDIYSAITELEVFNNPDNDDVLHRLDVTFGVEIPGTSFQVMAKYSDGANDITFTQDSQLMLGLFYHLLDGVRE